MVKRILNFFVKDIVNALRDNIVIYVLLFPIIGAGVLALLLPGIESGSLTFVVNQNTVKGMEIPLAKYAKIEWVTGDEKIRERVSQFDDAIGLTHDESGYRLVLEGNELNDVKELAEIILINLLTDKPVADISFRSLGKTKSYIKEYMTILLLISCLLMASVMAAMNMVDEKEFQLLAAIKVSPVNIIDYLISRSLSIFFITLILATLEVVILFGLHVSYLMQILLISLFSIFLGLFSAFIVGGFVDNKIAAIGIMKSFFLVFTSIPIAAIFVPNSWHWVFYLFPNYWLYNSFRNVFIDNPGTGVPGFWISNLVTMLQSVVYLFLLLFIIRKQFRLRFK